MPHHSLTVSFVAHVAGLSHVDLEGMDARGAALDRRLAALAHCLSLDDAEALAYDCAQVCTGVGNGLTATVWRDAALRACYRQQQDLCRACGQGAPTINLPETRPRAGNQYRRPETRMPASMAAHQAWKRGRTRW